MLDPIVEGYDVEHVQVLALVLVDTFYLNVEQARGIHIDAGSLPDNPGQSLFIRLLDLQPFPLEGRARGKGLESAEFCLQIAEPSVAQLGRDQLRQPRIAERDPPAGGDAVGNVMEFLREQFVEVM